jgi:hypothetical protein
MPFLGYADDEFDWAELAEDRVCEDEPEPPDDYLAMLADVMKGER